MRISTAEARRHGLLTKAKCVPKPVAAARWSFTLSVPTVVKSEANLRQHWAVKMRRKNEQRAALAAARAFRPAWERPSGA